MENDYASYLIRLCQEELEEGSVLWRGELESIQTGQIWHFSDLQSLCEFLHASISGNKTASGKKEHQQATNTNSNWETSND